MEVLHYFLLNIFFKKCPKIVFNIKTKNFYPCIFTNISVFILVFYISGEHMLPDILNVKLANGDMRSLPILWKEEVLAPPQEDKVKDYGHLVLELGTQFHYFLELSKTPDRPRLLSLFKMMMMTMHSNNDRAIKVPTGTATATDTTVFRHTTE